MDQTPSAPLHVVVFGRPGSGKSSLGERLSAAYGFVPVRTGELLREAVRRGDDLGRRVAEHLKDGHLVPDPLILELLEQTLKDPGHTSLLFDGFPRTLGQVPLLDEFERTLHFQIDAYLDVQVGRAEATARMTGRRVCPECGTTYHVVSKPPKVEGVCDRDGTRLERRPDDTPATIDQRQDVYDRHAGPILDHYRRCEPGKVRPVDGGKPFPAVFAEACAALGLAPPAAH